MSHQFIDDTSNHRTDQWSRSVEDRCRFPLRVIDEICSVYESNRVGIKLSPGGGYNDMGLEEKDTAETYGYLIKELNDRLIAYIQLARYLAYADPEKRGRVVDIFQWRRLINSQHTALLVNAGYDSKKGAEALETGLADAIVFGRLYISNPDLTERLINNQELNTNLVMTGLNDGQEEGYTDYPTYEQQEKLKSDI